MKNERFISRLNHRLPELNQKNKEVKEMEMNTMIKVKKDTREVLNNLKIIERESYDDVIKRLILLMSENEGALNKITEKMLKERLELKNKGKVLSIKELLKKMDDSDHRKDGRKV